MLRKHLLKNVCDTLVCDTVPSVLRLSPDCSPNEGLVNQIRENSELTNVAQCEQKTVGIKSFK